MVKRPLKQIRMEYDLDTFYIVNITKTIENIKVISPCKEFTQFEGKIKFKENPKSQHLDINNFVVGGSKIVGNE